MCSIGGYSHIIQSYLNHIFWWIKSFFLSADSILIAAPATRQICVYTRNRELLYRISLRTAIWGKYRFEDENFDENRSALRKKSRDQKNKNFRNFIIVPDNAPMLHKSHLACFCDPEDSKGFRNRCPFHAQAWFSLVILGFPCQNFIHSSRHAYHSCNTLRGRLRHQSRSCRRTSPPFVLHPLRISRRLRRNNCSWWQLGQWGSKGYSRSDPRRVYRRSVR